MTGRRALLLVVAALLVLNLVGWVISVVAELPAEFDGVVIRTMCSPTP